MGKYSACYGGRAFLKTSGRGIVMSSLSCGLCLLALVVSHVFSVVDDDFFQGVRTLQVAGLALVSKRARQKAQGILTGYTEVVQQNTCDCQCCIVTWVDGTDACRASTECEPECTTIINGVSPATPVISTDEYCDSTCKLPGSNAMTAAERMQANLALLRPDGNPSSGGYTLQATCEQGSIVQQRNVFSNLARHSGGQHRFSVGITSSIVLWVVSIGITATWFRA